MHICATRGSWVNSSTNYAFDVPSGLYNAEIKLLSRRLFSVGDYILKTEHCFACSGCAEPIWQALIWETTAEVVLNNGCQVILEKQILVRVWKMTYIMHMTFWKYVYLNNSILFIFEDIGQGKMSLHTTHPLMNIWNMKSIHQNYRRLSYLPLVPHISINDLDHHWFR